MVSCIICGYTSNCMVALGLHAAVVHNHEDIGLAGYNYPDCQRCLYDNLEVYKLVPVQGGKYAVGCVQVGETYMQAPSASGPYHPVTGVPLAQEAQ